jgi:MoaA/NifB/PqqE/SkfB family radical SAM enzyme
MLGRAEMALEIHSVGSTFSPSFCSLRWRYAQVDLKRGKVKACCKTPFHKVDDAELEAISAKALFNNAYFVERRKEMLAGRKHSDCSACWRHEEVGVPSYRQVQGLKAQFATPSSPKDAEAELADAYPTHLEMILSTLCDLACVYCDPNFSSAWAAEARQNGLEPEPDVVWEQSASATDFEGAFWEWYEACLPRLEYLQFNGGEPLLQKEFYRAIDRLLASDVEGLQVGLVTNLNTPPAQFSRFLSRIPDLVERFDLRIGVSQEAVLNRAEYIRYGLDWSRFTSNLEALIDVLGGRPVNLVSTLSVLSVTSFPAYVDFILELSERRGVDFVWRTNLVHAPTSLDPLMIGPAGAVGLEVTSERLRRLGRWPVLQAWLLQVAQALRSDQRASSLSDQRAGFKRYVRGLDARRGQDFQATFPDVASILA